MLTPSQLIAVASDVALRWRRTADALDEAMAGYLAESDALSQDLQGAVRTSAGLAPRLLRRLADLTPATERMVRRAVTSALAASARSDAAAISGALAALSEADQLAIGNSAEAVVSRIMSLARRDNLSMVEDARRTYVGVVSRYVPQVQRGTMSPERAVAEAVREMAERGVCVVDYSSGRREQPDVAIRRHVQTQVGQVAATRTMEACERLGVELVEVSSHTGARPSHRRWQGRVFSLHGTVTVGGVTYRDLREATGYGEAGGLCGVNCVPGDTLVSGPSAIAAFRREYKGNLVVIHTPLGDELSATPNHPVLTDHGWVPAQLVKEGDHVFRAVFRDGVPVRVGPHDDEAPARIAEVFDALGDSGEVDTLLGSPGDFHGDGALDGKVDVVLSDRLLVDDAESLAGEHIAEDSLHRAAGSGCGLPADCALAEVGVGALHPSDSIMCGDGKGGALVGSHSGEPGPHGVRAALGRMSVLREPSADDHVPRSHSHGDVVLRHAGLVQPDDFLVVEREPSSVGSEAEFPEVSRDDLSATSETLRDAFYRKSFLVEACEVANVELRSFSGHVYNLSTTSGWYFANGIITHNCRHSFAPYVPGRPRRWSETPDEDEGLDPDEHYKLTQRQRAVERKIREAKREVAADRAAGVDDTDARLRLGRAQAEMRQLLKDGGGALDRQPARERAFGEDGKPVAARGLTTDPRVDERHSSELASSQRDARVTNDQPNTLNRGAQRKHIKGTKEYNEKLESMRRRGSEYPSQSYLTVNLDEAEKLVEEFAGKGVAKARRDGTWSGSETCDAGRVIGYTVDKDGTETETSKFSIKYKDAGTHIVPVRQTRNDVDQNS